mgnify:CR=1 FL=1
MNKASRKLGNRNIAMLYEVDKKLPLLEDCFIKAESVDKIIHNTQ